MAFITFPISKNKVHFTCDSLADAGTLQDLNLATNTTGPNNTNVTLPLLGKALPSAGASAAQVQTHLRVTIVRSGAATPAVTTTCARQTVTLDNVDGGGLGNPCLHVGRLQLAGGANDGEIEGYIERIQSPEL